MDTIYLRTTFDVTSTPRRAKWVIYHDDDAIVYLNGQVAERFRGYNTGHSIRSMSSQALRLIRPGTNTIAVYCRNLDPDKGNPGFIDVGIQVDE